MVTPDDIKKLAALSRLSLSDSEAETLKGEVASILAYIDTIQKVELPSVPQGSVYLDIENVMREDVPTHEAGVYTEDLLKQSPRSANGYVQVKKILG
jgi:aspartyl-tRNA(Asn)/glutamyl-tRNA(Gln) amidotransferase subunit C